MRTTSARLGRPRSQHARDAVLHAVDDLLLDVGYAAMTMKGIAERAGVGRQTLYRWWATKAEILFEASVIDAGEELAVPASGDARADLQAYLQALVHFLARSPAGAAYRALLGEAQHDPAVAALIAGTDVVAGSAAEVLRRSVLEPGTAPSDLDRAVGLLVGPAFYWIISGREPEALDVPGLVATYLSTLDPPDRGDGDPATGGDGDDTPAIRAGS